MKKVEKARELIEKHGFSRNIYTTCEQYEQYEKTYKGSYYSIYLAKKVIVTIELYTDEDDAEANIISVKFDDCGDLTDLKSVQDAIEQAVDDIEELQDEIDDLEGDKD